MTSSTGLSLYCQSDGQKGTGTKPSSQSIVLAPEAALGSHPCVALSSAQANNTIPNQVPMRKPLTKQPVCRGVDKPS